MRRLRALVLPWLLAAGLPAALAAQAPPPTPLGSNQGGDPLRIYLATYGQGGAVWELFGHNALWVQDARTGQTISYNWGSFSFDQPGFVPRLIRGSMLYWLDTNDAEREVEAYRYWDRSITVQELNLAPAQKQALQQFVEWNALPENRFYEYHYYRDNCSTRVRDALDRVLGGQLGQQLRAIRSNETFRSHSLRLTARAPLTYTGIELGLADSADHPLTAWEEAFVPMELMRRVRDVHVLAPDGGTRPLVLGETRLFQSSRPEPLARAPNRVPLYLAAGVLIGMVFVLLAQITGLLELRRARGAGVVRAVFAVLAGAWSLLVGGFGLLVLLLWTATGHTFTYGNENLFQVNPLPLLLVGLIPLAVRRRGRVARWARGVAAAVAALSLLGLLLKVLPGFDQMNHDIIALVLPVHLALLAAIQLVLFRERDAQPSPAADTATEAVPTAGRAGRARSSSRRR